MSNKSGKTLTIFLLVLCVLFLSLTGITLYYFLDRSQKLEDTEAVLSKSKAAEAKLNGEIQEARRKINLLEEQKKEVDEKIEGLLDDVELEKSLKEELQTENKALREALSSDNKEKEDLHKELISIRERYTSLEKSLEEEKQLRANLQEQFKGIQQEPELFEEEVELETIFVTPEEVSEGKVLSINRSNNFAIFSLGKAQGIQKDQILSVFRGSNYLGDVKVVRIQANMSVADAIPPLTIRHIRKNDRVVIKE